MSQRRFAVFDIDGTLIRWQLYHAVVDQLAGQGLIDQNKYQAMLDARMVWKRREFPESFKAYEATVIDAYESALTELPVAKFNTIAEATARKYKTQVYRYTRDLVRDLKEKGYVLLAISGSHQELVEQICAQYGFDDCVGTQYEQRKGRFTGEKTIGSHNKQAALYTLIEKHDLTLDESYAVGDSLSDATMLEMVTHPIAFNPDQQLFDRAQAEGWDVVVERKNVIYQLRASDGHYQLQ